MSSMRPKTAPTKPGARGRPPGPPLQVGLTSKSPPRSPRRADAYSSDRYVPVSHGSELASSNGRKPRVKAAPKVRPRGTPTTSVIDPPPPPDAGRLSPMESSVASRRPVNPELVRGTVVQRNPRHWRYGDQDGGAGLTGVVLSHDSEQGLAMVRWYTHGKKNRYRYGHGGVEDVVPSTSYAAFEEWQGLRPLIEKCGDQAVHNAALQDLALSFHHPLHLCQVARLLPEDRHTEGFEFRIHGISDDSLKPVLEKGLSTPHLDRLGHSPMQASPAPPLREAAARPPSVQALNTMPRTPPSPSGDAAPRPATPATTPSDGGRYKSAPVVSQTPPPPPPPASHAAPPQVHSLDNAPVFTSQEKPSHTPPAQAGASASPVAPVAPPASLPIPPPADVAYTTTTTVITSSPAAPPRAAPQVVVPVVPMPVQTGYSPHALTDVAVASSPPRGVVGATRIEVLSKLDPSAPRLLKLTLKGDVAAMPVVAIKKSLEAYTAVPAAQQVLERDGVELLDAETGAQVGLRQGSTLTLHSRPRAYVVTETFDAAGQVSPLHRTGGYVAGLPSPDRFALPLNGTPLQGVPKMLSGCRSLSPPRR